MSPWITSEHVVEDFTLKFKFDVTAVLNKWHFIIMFFIFRKYKYIVYKYNYYAFINEIF